MIRFTTPTIPIEVEADLSTAEIIVSLVQGSLQLDKIIDPADISVEDGKTSFSISLSQEETARFCSDKHVQIQCNAVFPDDTRIATAITRIPTFENLLDQVVEYDGD